MAGEREAQSGLARLRLRPDRRREFPELARGFQGGVLRGRRILRLFTNVNPEGEARVWQVGEAFEALWRSAGHATPQEALAALAAHLAAPGGPGRGQSSDLGRP